MLLCPMPSLWHIHHVMLVLFLLRLAVASVIRLTVQPSWSTQPDADTVKTHLLILLLFFTSYRPHSCQCHRYMRVHVRVFAGGLVNRGRRGVGLFSFQNSQIKYWQIWSNGPKQNVLHVMCSDSQYTYSHASHNDVSVNDAPPIGQWSLGI